MIKFSQNCAKMRLTTLFDYGIIIIEKIYIIALVNRQVLFFMRKVRWEDIAVKLGYTRQWIFVLHGRALKNFEGILKNTLDLTKIA